MSKQSVVEDGRLTVSLYHGTSSIHFNSIKAAGLGGRNIVEEMGLRKAARLLLELTAAHRDHDEWLEEIAACTKIAANPADDRLVGERVFSFRYGGTYLSASRETAATYSFLYMEGGEALKYTLRLYRRLAQLQPDVAFYPEFATLAGFINRGATPLVVEARGVRLDWLRTEQGSDQIDTLLSMMEMALDEPDSYDGLVQQRNFELTQPVPYSQLRFHSVTKAMEFDKDGGSREVVLFTNFTANQSAN